MALPAPHEAPRCADFTRDLAVDPGGTAIRADVLIAAELPLPWPKPVFDHPALAGVRDAMVTSARPSRVLAAVPRDTGALEVVRHERIDGGSRRTALRTDLAGLAATVIALLEGDVDQGEPVGEHHPEREVWICTQGSHDSCCGSDGTRLALDVEERFQDVVVRRVSHTGGHRFAPTALTLPDGRMWGYLDPDGLAAILRRDGDPASVADRCRGWWGAETGPAQVAERGLLWHTGWTWELAPRWTETVSQVDDVTIVDVHAGERPDGSPLASWRSRVGVARQVATIACRAPGGQPAKPALEYELLDFEPL